MRWAWAMWLMAVLAIVGLVKVAIAYPSMAAGTVVVVAFVMALLWVVGDSIRVGSDER